MGCFIWLSVNGIIYPTAGCTIIVYMTDVDFHQLLESQWNSNNKCKSVYST